LNQEKTITTESLEKDLMMSDWDENELIDGIHDPLIASLVSRLADIRENIDDLKKIRDKDMRLRIKYMDKSLSEYQKAYQRIRKKSKSDHLEASLMAIRKFINKTFNAIFDNKFVFHAAGDDFIYIQDINRYAPLEHAYIRISSQDLYNKATFFSKWRKYFEFEDLVRPQLHTKRTKQRYKTDWVEYNGRPKANFINGGWVAGDEFLDQFTCKKEDVVDAILCKNEFVFTQLAVEGASFCGSHKAGAQFLYTLQDYFEKLAVMYRKQVGLTSNNNKSMKTKKRRKRYK